MPAAQNVVSTWIVLDDPGNSSVFPQMGRFRDSSDPQVQQTYWHCVAVFFAAAAKADSSCSLRLYTNDIKNLASAEPAVRSLLQELTVEVVEVPLRHLPPAGYYHRWRNQFYILDILEHISGEDDSLSHIVMDSDCLCLRPLAEVFAAIAQCGALTLLTGERLGQDINGLTREDMEQLFLEMGNCPLDGPPEYFGGEFFAATGAMTRRISALAERAWRLSLERYELGQPRFFEEAHLLTYVSYQLGLAAGTANLFIKRIWTGFHYRNGEAADAQLPIVHLPAEKRYGFETLYKAVCDRSSWFYTTKDHARWIAKIQKIVSIPHPGPFRLATELLGGVKSRAERLLSSR